MKKTSLLGLLFLLLAAPLHAQSGLARAKAGLPASAARSFEQTVLAAKKKGLPTEPLIDKALEGSAKRVPPAAIVEAVRKKADMLSRADAALRPFGKPAPADVISTADALQRGLSVDVVKRVRAGRRNSEPVGMALHTVADLIDRKVPATVAMEVISSWRQRGGHNDELRDLPAAVERLIRQGESPTAAGRSVAKSGGTRGKPPGTPGGRSRTSGRGNAGPGNAGAGSGVSGVPATPPGNKGRRN